MSFSIHSLPEALIYLLLEEWLSLPDFLLLESAACNRELWKCIHSITSLPRFAFHIGTIGRKLDSSALDYQKYIQYLKLRSISPRQFVIKGTNFNILENLTPSMRKSIRELEHRNAIREFMLGSVFFDGLILPAVEHLSLSQRNLWYPDEDEDFFDCRKLFILLKDQFPSLKTLQLSMGNNGCTLDLNDHSIVADSLSGLQHFHLLDTYLSTSTFQSIITLLSKLPNLVSLKLFCEWHPESSSIENWRELLISLSTTDFSSFDRLEVLCGNYDVIALLLHLAPGIKELSLLYTGTVDDSVEDFVHQYLSFNLKSCFHLLEKIEFSASDRFPVSASTTCSLGLHELLKVATQFRSLHLHSSGRLMFHVQLRQWLQSLLHPLASFNDLLISSKCLSSIGESSKDLMNLVATKLPNLCSFSLCGEFLDQYTISALKPLESLKELKSLHLSSLSAVDHSLSISTDMIDLRHFRHLKSLIFHDIQCILDDAYWQNVLPFLSHLTEWKWSETIEVAAITSHVGDLFIEMCPMLRIFVGIGIWKEINASMLFRLATSRRCLNHVVVAMDSSSIIDHLKNDYCNIVSENPFIKRYSNPRIAVSSMEKIAVM